MPFDATPVHSPLPDNIAAQSALVLDMAEFYFREGKRWCTAGLAQRGEPSAACLEPLFSCALNSATVAI